MNTRTYMCVMRVSPDGAKYYVALTALWGGGFVVTIGLTPYPLFCHPYGVLKTETPLEECAICAIYTIR